MEWPASHRICVKIEVPGPPDLPFSPEPFIQGCPLQPLPDQVSSFLLLLIAVTGCSFHG